MCTVTYLPKTDSFILTSNRDEKHRRALAIPPLEYIFNGMKLVFPKDGDAGGTWYAVNGNGYALVLLNGGREAHQPLPPYRISRGLVLLSLASAMDPVAAFEETDFHGVEPFTIIICRMGFLTEGCWTGAEKIVSVLNPSLPAIWSSSTLYDEETRRRRKSWFDNWIRSAPGFSTEEVIRFHRFGGDGNKTNDLVMDRNGHMYTQSICSAEITQSGASFHYLDLRSHNVSETGFLFDPETIPL